MSDALRFKNLKEAEDYYFANFAKNNEDESGLERWLETEDMIIGSTLQDLKKWVDLNPMDLLGK